LLALIAFFIQAALLRAGDFLQGVDIETVLAPEPDYDWEDCIMAGPVLEGF
jgi:hypothetical protein